MSEAFWIVLEFAAEVVGTTLEPRSFKPSKTVRRILTAVLCVALIALLGQSYWEANATERMIEERIQTLDLRKTAPVVVEGGPGGLPPYGK